MKPRKSGLADCVLEPVARCKRYTCNAASGGVFSLSLCRLLFSKITFFEQLKDLQISEKKLFVFIKGEASTLLTIQRLS